MEIRPARPSDLEGYYAVSLATGDVGRDAAHLYDDPRMMGHLYSAPYLIHSCETCLTLAAGQSVLGFLVGTEDTRAFEALLAREWWPTLRPRYADPSEIPVAARTPDQRRAAAIHHPRAAPDAVVSSFPAHLHLNLLPKAQGRGLGSTMLRRWLAARPDAAVHIGSNTGNTGAIAFWARQGFRRLPASDANTTWMGLDATRTPPP